MVTGNVVSQRSQRKVVQVSLLGGALFVLYVFFNQASLYIPWFRKDIIVHRNVCIVEKQGGKLIETENGMFASEKEIIVYNAKETKHIAMKVAASLSASVDSWPIRFETTTIPDEFSVQSYPVHFIIATHPGNLYHWWHDTTLGLYGVMKQTNRLNSSIANQVLHRIPVKDRTRFSEIVKALSVRDDQNVYHAMPSGTCYPIGVFGYKEASEEQVANFVIQQLDKKFSVVCPPGMTVTLIKRRFRKILNIDALLDVLLEAGFSNSRIVEFENMSFPEQWQTIRCTHILAGVQGAGLQWAVFLRPRSAMLELAYKDWSFLFSDMYKNFNGLRTGQLDATETFPNWNYISNLYFKGKPMTDAQKAEVPSSRNAKQYRDLWAKAGFKWADSKYDPIAFKKEIFALIHSMKFLYPPDYKAEPLIV